MLRIYYQLTKDSLKERNLLLTLCRFWNEDSITLLQGCFDCTMWDILEETSADINEFQATVYEPSCGFSSAHQDQQNGCLRH